MNQISDPPGTYNAGLEFNYAVWNNTTKLTLANVPWNNDYRDIVKFPTVADRDAYIESLSTPQTTISNSRYARVNEPIKISVPFSKAVQYNYIIASNPAQPILGGDVPTKFFYFITDVRHSAPNTTVITVQLDLWNTYGYLVKFGRCYIERGHIGIANERQFNDYGREYLTVPEGFDLGNEYVNITSRRRTLMNVRMSVEIPKQYHILVTSATNLEQSGGDVNSPTLETARGSSFMGMPSGAEHWVFPSEDSFRLFLNDHRDKPWVTQGISKIIAIPPITRYYPMFQFDANVAPLWGGTRLVAESSKPNQPIHPMYSQWRNSQVFRDAMPSRYHRLRKLWTYPYMSIEMTTWGASPLLIKPESWNNPDAFVVERATLVAPNERVQFYPRYYNAPSGTVVDQWGDDGGDYKDFFTQIANFPTFALVNNNGVLSLAASAATIAQQYQAADWSQNRALHGNSVSYDQATAGMDTSTALMNQGNAAAAASLALGEKYQVIGAGIGLIGGAGQGAVGGAVAGVPGMAAGAAMGAAGGVGNLIGTGVNILQGREAQALSAAANQRANEIVTGNSGFNRDTNKNLADWAARGDYSQSIAAMNARSQDAKLIQPSMSGQFGGETLDLVNGSLEMSLRWKMIGPQALAVIGEYWLRYGYAINRYTTPPESLHVMDKFTYWKMTETYISQGAMPESHRQAIRGIFEKGVTVWAHPSFIGNVDPANNIPLEGITL